MPSDSFELRNGVHSRPLPGVEYDDAELGAAHQTGPEDVVAAASLVRNGQIFDLDSGRWPAMPVLPVHPPFVLTTYRTPGGLRVQGDNHRFYRSNASDTGMVTELMISTVHAGTHIDALGHVTCGTDWRGGSESEDLGDFGQQSAEASSIPPIVSRGVLVDVAGHHGVEALEAGHEITREETLAALDVDLRPGDAVLFRTGYMRAWGVDPARSERHYGAGIGLDAARLLADAGAVLVGSDTEALEQQPAPDPDHPMPVHVELMMRRGIFILELAYLEDLAEWGVSEFMFVCLPLRIRGASGSMVRPIAVT